MRSWTWVRRGSLGAISRLLVKWLMPSQQSLLPPELLWGTEAEPGPRLIQPESLVTLYWAATVALGWPWFIFKNLFLINSNVVTIVQKIKQYCKAYKEKQQTCSFYLNLVPSLQMQLLAHLLSVYLGVSIHIFKLLLILLLTFWF